MSVIDEQLRRAIYLDRMNHFEIAEALEKVISKIDMSRSARPSNEEIADAYINDARNILLGLLGIK